MKMKLEDYQKLQEAIIQGYLRLPKHIRPLMSKEHYISMELSEMRWRWDLLHISGYNVIPMYSYLNDNHIDTALKNITNIKKEGE